MDDSETPTANLQIEPQDGSSRGAAVESTVTHLPSVPDENENQLQVDGCGCLSGSERAMGKPEVCEQDSVNNNEIFPPPGQAAAAARESWESRPGQGPEDEQAFVGKDKKAPAKRSARSKKGSGKKMPPGLPVEDDTLLMQEEAGRAATRTAGDAGPAEINANAPRETGELTLQHLCAYGQGAVEQLDSRVLPLCLHQMAESYFQEEDYEKAMKFIQLERLYHEQLLANLSIIQEQWEAKWKTVQPHTITSQRNSEKGFNGEDFELLTKFCTTHQDPVLSKHKTAVIGKSLARKCFTQLIVPDEDPKKDLRESEREACLGMDPGEESPPRAAAGRARSPRSRRVGPESLSEAAGGNQQAEPLGGPGAAGSRAGPRSGEPPWPGGGGSRPAEQQACEDVAAREGVPGDPRGPSPPGLARCDRALPALLAEDGYSQTQGTQLPEPPPGASEALPTDQPENNELNELPQPDLTDRDGKSPGAQTDSGGPERELWENSPLSDLSPVLPEVCMAPEEKTEEDDRVSKETEDYLNSLLEGCLKYSEDSLFYEDNAEDDDSDLLQDLSPEEASYSLQENLPSDDSSLSLDDLAKRIEIAEVVPVEGLVSILKKRNDAVGNHHSPMQQKPSKRRVRFQEIDDTLDQDEVGGGSCVLLILLCIVTVFLSVGGTALYCTFGDTESAVCTDFKGNVDFYYTKFMQGVAELKRWIYLS